MITKENPEVKTKTTYQDYLKINDKNRYQIIKGELVMLPSPNLKHQLTIGKLYKYLIEFVEDKNMGFVLLAPMDVLLDPKDKQENMFQPDIMYISNKNSKIMTEKAIMGSPDLVIEVLSPSSLHYDMRVKYLAYEEYGIKEYWIVNPMNKQIEIFVIDNGKYNLYNSSDSDKIVKSKVITGLEIDTEKIFI